MSAQVGVATSGQGPDGGSKAPQTDLLGSASLGVMLAATVAVGLLLFLTNWAALVIAPIGFGLILTVLVAPLFGWMIGRGVSPTIAILLTVVVLVVVGGGIVVFALYSSQQLGSSLALYSDELALRYPDAAATLASLGLAAVVNPDTMTNVLAATVSAIAEVASNAAFAIVLAALLLLDGPRLVGLVKGGLGSENPVFREYPAIARSALTYFMIRIKVNLITAGGLLIVMILLGVDDALLWAIAAFFLSFVPYVGLVIALIPPTILAFAETGVSSALLVLISGGVLNVLAENVLEPAMTSKALSLSTWLVFVMFFFTVWLIGPVGALLAMPLTVLLVLVLQDNPQTRWLAVLLTKGGGSEKPTSTEAAPDGAAA